MGSFTYLSYNSCKNSSSASIQMFAYYVFIYCSVSRPAMPPVCVGENSCTLPTVRLYPAAEASLQKESLLSQYIASWTQCIHMVSKNYKKKTELLPPDEIPFARNINTHTLWDWGQTHCHQHSHFCQTDASTYKKVWCAIHFTRLLKVCMGW